MRSVRHDAASSRREGAPGLRLYRHAQGLSPDRRVTSVLSVTDSGTSRHADCMESIQVGHWTLHPDARLRPGARDLHKSATPVRPAEGQCHRATIALRIGQLLVDRVSVAMNDAGIA